MRNCKFEKTGAVARITFARPAQRNPLNKSFYIEINEYLDEINDDPDVRVVLLTGEGDAFCSGADVKDLLHEERDMVAERNLIRDFIKIPLRMRSLDKPIIAAVNGPAAGGGVALALASDMIIASDQATFHMAFVRIGLSAADMGVTYFLPRNVGYAKAAELLMFGEVIGAEEAERIGMINKVVPHHALLPTAEEWAERIARGPSVGISLTKFALNREQGMDMSTALEMETYLQGFTMRTPDHKEAVAAFLNRRKPR